ncbi:putative Protein RCC2 protein [Naja naja]|nr:putative Protein RCC2 protein [Naja naja]
MPRRKADAASSGNGTGAARKRASTGRGAPLTAKKKNRSGGCSSSSSSNNGGGGSSGEEKDGLVLPLLSTPGGSKKAPRAGGREQQNPPGLQSPQAAVVVNEPEHTKERIKLEGSKYKGQLLIFGATNWDLIGRKEVPKQQVRTVISGPCAAHSLFITVEGKLWSWGRNDKGQLGHGDTKRVDAPKPIEVLSKNGSVFAFGENKMGQLGLGNQTDAIPSPTQIMYNGQPITKVACGAEFSMIMDCKGNLYSFGCPEYGQLGHNSDGKFIARAQRIEYDCELVPRRVAIFLEKTKDGQILPVPNIVVRDVACGANHTLILDSQKRVFSWGFGGYGRLGHAEQRDEMVPRLVKLFDFPGRGAAQIYAGYTCSFAVSETGGLFFWGATNTSRESTMYPKTVQDLCGWKIRSLSCGKSSIIVAADDSTISWGPSPTFGELVAMGYAHSLAIARDESEAEKEKIKKLPEYNPRTL